MPVWGHSRSCEDRRVKRGARPVLLGRHRLKVQDVGLETRLTACVVLGVESGGCHMGNVISQGTLGSVRRHFLLSQPEVGFAGLQWVEPGDSVRDGPHGRGPSGSTRLRKSGGGPSACLHLLGGDLMLPPSCCQSLSLPPEPRHRPGALSQRPGHRGLRQTLRAHPLLHQHRQEGVGQVDERGAHRAAETHV